MEGELPKRWLKIIDKYQFTQIINEPTRVTDNSQTCIDHIYVTNPEHVRKTKVPHIGLSDHYPACYVRKHHATYHTGEHNMMKFRSYKDFNEEAFVEDLYNVPWNLLDTFDDPDDALDSWKVMFMEVVDQHAPVKERRVKKAKQPDWFSDDIKEAMYLRDKYTDSNDMENATFWRNKTTEMVNRAKCTYYRELINHNLQDSKKLWGIINDLAPKQNSPSLVSIKSGDEMITDPQQIVLISSLQILHHLL